MNSGQRNEKKKKRREGEKDGWGVSIGRASYGLWEISWETGPIYIVGRKSLGEKTSAGRCIRRGIYLMNPIHAQKNPRSESTQRVCVYAGFDFS